MFGWENWGNETQVDIDPTKPKTFDDFDREVRAGLPAVERERMADAYGNLRYATGHFDDVEAMRNGKGPLKQTSELWDPVRPSADDTRYDKSDFTLAQPVMQRIVGKLTEHLYKRSPTRSLADKEISAVVNEVYLRNAMGPKWQRSDEYTTVGGFSGWQFAGLEDERNPVKIHLWGADQLCVWTDPKDHTRPLAACTVDKIDGRTHATLWTEDKVAEYVTRRDNSPGGSTRRFEPVGRPRDNPYRLPESSTEDDQGRGIIPFSFCHFHYPATEFTEDSPGTNLRELNRYINFGFDDLADGVRYLTKPIGLAEGVDEKWEAPAVVKPGMFLNLAPGSVDAGGNGPQPTLRYLEANNAFVQVIWSHLNNYLDTSMELVGVPPSTVRMVLDARSGVSILAEQAPLLGWTERRRRLFADYERSAVVMLLQVISAHLRNHGYDSSRFDASALDPGLSLLWPRLYVDLPGPERDRADGVRVQWGMASLLDIVQERDDCTREQALEKLKRVKADNDELAALGIEPVPAALAPPKPQQLGYQGQDQNQGAQAAEDLDQLASQGTEGKPIAGEPVDLNAKADDLSQEGG